MELICLEIVNTHQNHVLNNFSLAIDNAFQELSKSLTDFSSATTFESYEDRVAMRQESYPLNVNEVEWQCLRRPKSGFTSISQEIKLLKKSLSSGKEACTPEQVRRVELDNALYA